MFPAGADPTVSVLIELLVTCSVSAIILIVAGITVAVSPPDDCREFYIVERDELSGIGSLGAKTGDGQSSRLPGLAGAVDGGRALPIDQCPVRPDVRPQGVDVE